MVTAVKISTINMESIVLLQTTTSPTPTTTTFHASSKMISIWVNHNHASEIYTTSLFSSKSFFIKMVNKHSSIKCQQNISF